MLFINFHPLKITSIILGLLFVVSVVGFSGTAHAAIVVRTASCQDSNVHGQSGNFWSIEESARIGTATWTAASEVDSLFGVYTCLNNPNDLTSGYKINCGCYACDPNGVNGTYACDFFSFDATCQSPHYNPYSVATYGSGGPSENQLCELPNGTPLTDPQAHSPVLGGPANGWWWTCYGRSAGGQWGQGGNASCSGAFAPSPSQPTATLSVNPATVANGGASTVAWSSTNVTSCTVTKMHGVSGGGNYSSTVFSQALSGSQSTGPLNTSTWSTTDRNGKTTTGVSNTYDLFLNCYNGYGNQAYSSATVTIVPGSPDLTAGSVSPTSATAGVAVTFSSTISNIGSASTGAPFNNFMQVAANPNGGGTITDILPSVSMATLSASGSSTFSKSYTFSANGSYSLRVCADLPPQPNGVIAESNENNNCGAWTNVVVSSAPPASCSATTINNCSLPTTPSGSSAGSCASGYSGSCNYSCSGGTWGMNSNSCATVPTATLSADDTSVNVGNSTMLRWSSTNATSCTGTGFTANGTSGSVSTGILNTVGTQSYQINCSGALASASVQVVSPNVTITANPTRVRSGERSVITWSASGVTSCEVTNPLGNKLASGNADHGSNFSTNSPYTATITSQSTYTIICKMRGGRNDLTDSVTVNVIPIFQEF